jgi:glycosyltransferase involved in cell wall biosynthesis
MIAVATLFKNSQWILRDYLAALQSQTHDAQDIRLIFLDDASRDDTLPLLRAFAKKQAKRYASIEVLASAEAYANNTSSRDLPQRDTAGYAHLARLRNTVLARARSLDVDHALLLDSDILMTPGCLDALLAWKVPCVGTLVNNDAHCTGVLNQDPMGWVSASLNGRTPARGLPADSLCEVLVTCGAVLIDRTVLDSPARFAAHRDDEVGAFCYALRDAGIPRYVDTTRRAVHVMEARFLSDGKALLNALTLKV